MKNKKHFFHKENGQNLLEFAFTTSLFFMLIFSIIEGGRGLWTWNALVQATRAGARYAAVETPTANDTQIKKMVVYNDPNGDSSSTPVVPGLTEANVTVRYLNNDGSVASNKNMADTIEVSITNYQFIAIARFLGGTVTLPASTTILPLEGLGAY